MESLFRDGARAGCAAEAARFLAPLAPSSDGAPAALSARALLERVFALAPRAWMRRMPGRETFRWPEDGGLVVKRFRGGERRDWWYERLRGAVRSPGRRECENLRDLAADGFRVPRCYAWFEERRALLPVGAARSGLVMERVPHRRTVRDALAEAGAEERAEWSARLAPLVARLHAAGWYHRDLYLQHFIVSDAVEEPVLLDVGRARRERAPRRRWLVKDLAALLHSAPPSVTRAERLRFLRGYLRERGVDGTRALRAWARDVAQKERRLAAHAPRHVDPAAS